MSPLMKEGLMMKKYLVKKESRAKKRSAMKSSPTKTTCSHVQVQCKCRGLSEPVARWKPLTKASSWFMAVVDGDLIGSAFMLLVPAFIRSCAMRLLYGPLP